MGAPGGGQVELEREVPFVGAVLDEPARAVQLLRQAEAAHGLWIVDDEDAEPGDGVFVPRDGEPLPEGEVRRMVRSWEQFDRVFEREPEGRAAERLRGVLWPFLDDTRLILGGVDFAPDHLIMFDDGAVGTWSAASWGRVLAEWARARRWASRDDWQQDHFAGSLEGLVRDYARFRDGARAAIRRD